MSDPKRRAGIRVRTESPGGVTAAPEVAVVRDALSFWATGVTVVTVRDETGVHGLTASAFTPVSVEPPVVLVCVSGDAPILTHVLDACRFTVNILAAEQKRVANVFSDRLAVTLPEIREGDDAIIEGCLANLVCRLDRDIEAGDHHILIGSVTSVQAVESGAALLYYRRKYGFSG